MSLTYRPARLADLEQVVTLCAGTCPDIGVPVSRCAIRKTVEPLIGNHAHFAWVAELDGKVVATLLAQTDRGNWHEKLQCFVVAYASKVTGACMCLMRRLAKWVKGRSLIKAASIELRGNCAYQRRMARVLGRLGFTSQSVLASYVRSA